MNYIFSNHLFFICSKFLTNNIIIDVEYILNIVLSILLTKYI